ncbi:hypothetical protein [Mycobacterium shinjukuense]|uniref:hypothetical protein n=1 Tax=Mycobacterium shinjukuense TaxID=398694 RepID=UPI0031013F99
MSDILAKISFVDSDSGLDLLISEVFQLLRTPPHIAGGSKKNKVIAGAAGGNPCRL